MRSRAAAATGVLSGLTLALGLAAPANGSAALAQAAASETGRPQSTKPGRVLEVARQVMVAARYCTMVTLGEKHEPQARIMDPLAPDAALTVYVATNPRSRKVAEIRRDARITLLYFDPIRPAYVTLIGRAIEVGGAEKRSHHKDDWQAFFPRENPDSYTLYRIEASRVEVVSAQDGLSGDPATWRPEIIDLK